MNIIVLPLYGIGDVLMTTPALKVLKTHLKDCRITYLNMFRSTYEVLRNNPNIDSLLHFPFLEKSALETLRYALPLRGKFDCSINFYPSNRRQYNMLAYLIGARTRIGHHYLHLDNRELNFLKNRTVTEDPRLHNVEENMRLLEFLGIKADTVPPMEIFLSPEEDNKGEVLIGPSPAAIKIGVHAGTSIFKGHANKRWPRENFVELINRLPEYGFYLFGDKDEEEANAFISDSVADRQRIIMINGAPIREVAAAIKKLDLFIANDSGLMHLAAACGTPVVALFGPTNPDLVRPWGINHRVVRLDSDCSPCFYYSPRPLKCVSPNEYACIRGLPVSAVGDAVEQLLSETGKIKK
ncbi:MAG: glycosyltransferase family 9 protein [Nitrospirae bacterium]|nr:glycosyltransferase family 9 protein [Nitrospirota bacterium]